MSNNPLSTRTAWNRQREEVQKNLGEFHANIAKREIFWFLPTENLWVKLTGANESSQWTSLCPPKSGLKTVDLGANFLPWKKTFDDTHAPFYQWFKGGLTNACFNEVDAHVLSGHGEEIALIFEGDRWDPSLNGSKGGPVVSKKVSRKELLLEVAVHALILKKLGLKKGDTIILNMPNILDQIYYIEAAKRLGVIYTCVFGGFSARTLSDRIHDSGAKVIITTDGAYRNAQVVPFKQSFADAALDNYISVEVAIETLQKTLSSLKISEGISQKIVEKVQTHLETEISVDRSEVMIGLGQALENMSLLNVKERSSLRRSLIENLIRTPERVNKTIVVNHVGIGEINWNPKRDVWSSQLAEEALGEILKVGGLSSRKSALELSTDSFIELIYKVCPPQPVDAEFPLFIMYTSGSTGKPKGVVHTHGGYVAGVAHTMRISFDVNPEGKVRDVMYVVADPGWITGQSYMISASLTTRTTSIIAEGSPIFPHAGRFTSMIERYGVTVFKAGSTFLKSILAEPENIADIKKYNRSTLKVGTFCAEPTSPSIQQMAMDLLTPNYINSYWATEHGGIILTHFFGNKEMELKADTHTFPLPWIFAEVRIGEEESSQLKKYRIAEPGEKGELVISKPYPYLARTIWGDQENVCREDWKGDFDRFKKTYFNHWKSNHGPELVYTQGDFACRYENESFTLHGRSDDVINTSGHRIGTEEIEGALLREIANNPQSIVRNVIVIGAPDDEKGTVPVAFVLTSGGRSLALDDEQRLNNLVREIKGSIAIPAGYICLSQLPETRSGKYLRRILKNFLENEEIGDVSTLKNPECLNEIEDAIKRWKSKVNLVNKQTFLELHSTLRVEYHELLTDKFLAVVTISKPPVNALDERTLDELHNVIDHLGRKENVKAIVITGSGTSSFIAGADVRQLFEEMQRADQVLPLPRKCAQTTLRIEHLKKPVIAAINGIAFGGGNEFLLATHYRICEPHARFAQPEINLHLIPGYGGTQRLTRIFHELRGNEGILEAIQIVVGGREIDPIQAVKLGFIDEVSESGDVVSRAAELVRGFLNGTDLTLNEAMERRQRLNTRWSKGNHFPKEILEHSEVLRLKKQAALAGREKPFQWAMKAIVEGFEKSLGEGLGLEGEIFSQAVVDSEGGKKGIKAFFEKRSAPLPTRRDKDLEAARKNEKELIEKKLLLPEDKPFFPGITPIPKYQYSFCITRNSVSGTANHGDPKDVEIKEILPVCDPAGNEALLFMITSEINFNDLWAITGIPVSPLDNHDMDWHVTGSGGLALVASVGSELKAEGRVKVGDLVVVFSGQSEVLSPVMGLDPMFANQKIQGYETGDGSHQQFMLVQGPQIHAKPPNLTLEEAGSYILNLGTVYRALFTTLGIQSGKTMFVEGAATGTGSEAVKVASRNGVDVVGLVSTEDRKKTVIGFGGKGAINRLSPTIEKIFTPVPKDKKDWEAWEKSGFPLLEMYKAQTNGRLADYSVSHSGELSFPRSFQLLGENGILAFFGASSGYHFTFIGKSGNKPPVQMLKEVGAKAGDSILVYYGEKDGAALDESGIEAIESCREKRLRTVVCTWTDAQREFVKSMGFGSLLLGVFSIEEIQRKEHGKFHWHETMPELPNPKTNLKQFKEGVRLYQEYTFKPFANYVGNFLKSGGSKESPDYVLERANQDTLALSVMVVKPFTGRVVYFEDMSHKRYSFYAPQVWMRQRKIDMPTAHIWGTHLCNSYEVTCLNKQIQFGAFDITPPYVVPFNELPNGHQEMWDNKHKSPNYVLNHALPRMGMKSKDELMQAWSIEEGKQNSST